MSPATQNQTAQSPHISLETNLFKDGYMESVNQGYESLAAQIIAATDGGASGRPPPIDVGDFADRCLLFYAVILHTPAPTKEPKKKKRKKNSTSLRNPRLWRSRTLLDEFERTKRASLFETKLDMEIDAETSLEALADSAFHSRRDPYFDLSSDEEEEEEDEPAVNPPGLGPTIEQVIGVIYLLATPHNSEAAVGVAILPGWRGEGHAATAVEMILNHAFGMFGFHRVVASIPESVLMHRAARTFMRFGFTHEGTRRKATFCPLEHAWKDVTSLGLLDTDWSIREAQARAGKFFARSPWDEMMARHERERNALMENEALQPTGSFDGMHVDSDEMVMEDGRMVRRKGSTETIRNVRAGGSGGKTKKELQRLSQAMWDDTPAPTPTPSTSGSEWTSSPKSGCSSLPDSPRIVGKDEVMSGTDDDDEDDDLYMDTKTPASGGEDLRKIWANAVAAAGPSSPPRQSVQPSSSPSSSPKRVVQPTLSASTSAAPAAAAAPDATAPFDFFRDPADPEHSDSELDWEDVSVSDSISVISGASNHEGSVAGSESGSFVSSVSDGGVRSLSSDAGDEEEV